MPRTAECEGPGAASRRPIAFVKVDTQHDNAGDCLINRELIRLLAERGDVFLDTGRCPVEFARQLRSIPRLDRRGPRPLRGSFYAHMLAAALEGRDCYWFLMPGAVTGDRRARFRLRSWVRDLPLRLAHAAGVKICQVGASFGDMTPAHLDVWRRRRRFLRVVSPRDSRSAAYLGSHGIATDPCIPDLAFNVFEDDSCRRSVGMPHGHGGSGDSPRIGCFSFRTDQAPRQRECVEAAMHAICRSLGAKVRWKPVVQVGRDTRGMAALRAALATAHGDVDPLVDLHGDLEACLGFYRGVSFVVSNRLHVLLMAASQGARVLAISGTGPGDRSSGAKLEGVLEDLGLEGAIYGRGDGLSVGPDGVPGVVVRGSEQRDRLRQAFDALLRSRGRAAPSRARVPENA